jgi:hypothetical protein
VEHSPFLKKIATYQSVSEKAKLIRGDPPKIALKRRRSPLKMKKVKKAGPDPLTLVLEKKSKKNIQFHF